MHDGCRSHASENLPKECVAVVPRSGHWPRLLADTGGDSARRAAQAKVGLSSAGLAAQARALRAAAQGWASQTKAGLRVRTRVTRDATAQLHLGVAMHSDRSFQSSQSSDSLVVPDIMMQAM